MSNKTPLFEKHLEMGGKIVDFSGWQMPIHYGSQLEEHRQVRNDAGMFDVSHMTILDMKGDKVKPFLEKLFANNINKLKTKGKALYSCMLNENGGVIDDLITYYLEDEFYRTVVNAATREKDIAWINNVAKEFNVDVIERKDLAMIAVQGPKARERAAPLLPKELAESAKELKPFNAVINNNWMVARTGYTGENGFEVVIFDSDLQNPEKGIEVWNAILEAGKEVGIALCGLGARDALRIEAGLPLYGEDIHEEVNPVETGYDFSIFCKHNKEPFYFGKEAILKAKNEGVKIKHVGVILKEKGIPRADYDILNTAGEKIGYMVNGVRSPVMGKVGIGMGFVDIKYAEPGTDILVKIRDRQVKAEISKLPFYDAKKWGWKREA